MKKNVFYLEILMLAVTHLKHVRHEYDERVGYPSA